MKNMNIMFGKRKGITPVIALVLLLMMTVAAAGMAYIWFQDVQQETQDSVSDSLTQRTDQMAGAVVIDAVYEDTNVAQVAVRNTGSVTFSTDVIVYVGSTPCATANVNNPTESAVVACGVQDLTDDIVIRAIPPQGSAIYVTCDIRPLGGGTNDDYCNL